MTYEYSASAVAPAPLDVAANFRRPGLCFTETFPMLVPLYLTAHPRHPLELY